MRRSFKHSAKTQLSSDGNTTRKAREKRRATRRVLYELLEPRHLLAAVIAQPPNPPAELTEEVVRTAIQFLPSRAQQLLAPATQALAAAGASLAFQAFPGEVNNVRVGAQAGNLILQLDESSDNLLLRLAAPGATIPFSNNFIQNAFKINVGGKGQAGGAAGVVLAEISAALGGVITFEDLPTSIIKNTIDLPGSRAIVLNPAALLDLVPDLGNLVTAFNDILDFDVSNILPRPGDDGIEFPGLPDRDIRVGRLFTIRRGAIIRPFELIPSPPFDLAQLLNDAGVPTSLRDIIELLPGDLQNILNQVAGFVELFDSVNNRLLGDSIYISTLDGNDTIDTSNITGIRTQIFAGAGNDVITTGGGQNVFDVYANELLPFDPTFGLLDNQHAAIEIFGEGGSDTINIQRRYNSFNLSVDGGAGIDRLVVPGNDRDDIIEVVSDVNGNLEAINFLVPDPNSGLAANEIQQITLPPNLVGGTFTLTYTDVTGPRPVAHVTDPIPYEIGGNIVNAAQVQAALTALPGLSGNISVGGPVGGPFVLEFDGSLGNSRQALLMADGGGLVQAGRELLVYELLEGSAEKGTNQSHIIALPTDAGQRYVTGGAFRLEFDGETTDPILYSASSPQVENALAALSNIGDGNVRVSGPVGGPWQVEFVGQLGLQTLPFITATDEDLLLGGATGDVISDEAFAPSRQTIALPAPAPGNAAIGGTFQLTVDNGLVSDTTPPLPVTASALDVLEALEQLASVGIANAAVSGPLGGPWEVELVGRAAEVNLTTGIAGNITGGISATTAAADGSGQNEIQRVTINGATGGTFTLTFDNGAISRTTDPLFHDAAASEIEAALGALGSVGGTDNVSVSGAPGGPWDIEYTGDLGTTDLPLIEVDDAGLTPAPDVTVIRQTIQTAVAGVNELQEISFSTLPSGGTFQLQYEGELTDPLPFNATPNQVRAALETLTVISPGDVAVTATASAYEIEFTGRLRAMDVSSIIGLAENLAGGFASSDISAMVTSTVSNETQTLTLSPAPQAGTFTLGYFGEKTATIAFDASATDIENALAGLFDFDADDVVVSKTSATTWEISFQRQYAGINVDTLEVNTNSLSLANPIDVVLNTAAALRNETQAVALPGGVQSGTFTLAFRSLRIEETQAAGGGVNEIQQVSLPGGTSGGTFTLAFMGSETGPIAANASAAMVEAALQGLPSVAGANVSVTSVNPAGGPWEIEFQGNFASVDQPLITSDGSSLVGDFTTIGLGINATAAEVEAALESISSIGVGNVAVTSLNPTGGPWEVEFIGNLSGMPLESIQSEGSGLVVQGQQVNIELSRSGGDGQPVMLTSTRFTNVTSVESLVIEGGGGDDRLILRGASQFPLGIIFNGGEGTDSIEFISRSATPDFVAPIFPDDTQAIVTFDGQLVQFDSVEGGIEFHAGGQPGQVRFSGTDAGNEIRFAGVSPNEATLSRDGQVTTTLTGFADSSSLIIRGEQGDDVISIAPGPFTRFANIMVSGGGPSGADSILFEGTTGNDVFALTPDAASAKAGSMVINGSTVTFDGIEEVGIQGLEGTDALTVHEPVAGSNDYVLFSPEVGNNGSFQFTSQPGGPATAIVYSPVTYQSIEIRDFNTGTGVDTLSLSTDNLPGVNSSASVVGGNNGVTTAAFGDQSTTFTHDVDVNNPDILTFEIGTADDVVSVTPGRGIKIVVNTALGNDLLTYNGVVDDITLDTVSSTISQPGVGDVQFTNAETVQLIGNGLNGLAVLGAALENRYVYTPLTAQGGRFRSDQSDAAFVFSQIGGTFSLGGGTSVRDTVLVEGSPGPDRLFVDGPNRTVNATDTAGTSLKAVQLDTNIENASIDAGDGDDLIRVIPSMDLFVHINGNTPNASDRLLVEDTGPGDLVLHREASDGRSGSVTVGGLLPVDYVNVERVDILPLNPITGGTGTDGQGRLVVFHADPFEHNESLPNRTDFPALFEVPSNPNIDPGSAAGVFVNGPTLPGDEDWYRFGAESTATLRFELIFEPIGTLPNGNSGLPGDGQLQIEVYDPNNNLIPKFGGEGASTHTVGVEENQTYSLRVRGVTPEAINNYDIRVVSLDEIGPQVTDLFITDDPTTAVDESAYDLFDLKPSQGPTPLVHSLTIRIRDLSERFPGFLYDALDADIAAAVGQYQVVGDHNGIIPIWSIQVINDPVVVGEIATATIKLHFTEPLPDDRFTLTVLDNLVDPVGNRLDGESNAREPQERPLFPSGDSVSGGNFVARFTVDSRAEIGIWASGSAYIDTNGNFLWDPEAQFSDDTNEDIVYKLGFQTDNVFAGNFVADPLGTADGFDKLGTYGRFGGVFRWLIDTNNNGVPDLVVADPAQINGLPVAGNFDGNADNGDEVGLKDGTRWYLDTNHDFMVDTVINGNLVGLPVVGDFDGDGIDDLGAWADDVFALDLSSQGGIDGMADISFTFGFPGVREIPFAADFNGDGVDDLGLWNPDGAGGSSGEQGEWYVLMSQVIPNSALGSRPITIDGSATLASTVQNQYEMDEFIRVDSNHRYTLSAEARSGNDEGGQYDPANRQYFGFASYDSDQLRIAPWHVMKYGSAADTRLAATLRPGDTTITLEDATGWANAGAAHQRSLAWYGYSNSDGYTYPDYTYTRNVARDSHNGMWDANAIVGNVITLHTPWSGPLVEAGTAVRNATSGGTYNYSALSFQPVSDQWSRYDATLTGTGVLPTQFRPGTEFIKPIVLSNYQGGTNNLVRFRNIDLRFAETPIIPITDRLTAANDGTNGSVIHFTAVPFGPDLYATFGNAFGLPVVGNFDPPVAKDATPAVESVSVVGLNATNPINAYDVDGNGRVEPLDALKIINYLNRHGAGYFAEGVQVESGGIQQSIGPMLDVNADGMISSLDALKVINYLFRQGTAAIPAGEGERSLAIPLLETLTDEYLQERDRPSEELALLRSAPRQLDYQRSEKAFADWPKDVPLLREGEPEEVGELESALNLLAKAR